ncbi:MAG: outer membrane lipoprotein carrier protein LolA [Pseudomonadota bacterium]
MERRTFLAGTAALGLTVTAQPAAAKIPLSDLSSYLNSLKTAQGAFTQINSDGTLSKGTFFLARPGRMRFEYQDGALVLAGQGRLAIFDQKSNQGPQQYPLHQTPLSIILQDRVNLSRAGMLMGHEFDGTATSILAQDPDNPEYGSVRLKFTDSPTELRQWIVTDQSGQQTTVVLGKLDTGVRLRAGLFDIDRLVKEGSPRNDR